MIDIVLRTCSNTALQYAKTQRICTEPREEMIIKCVRSLVKAINFTTEPCYLHIFDDHSTPEFLYKLNLVLSNLTKPHSLKHTEHRGPNYSAYMQFLTAANAQDFAYTVEDDYFHTEDSIEEMVKAYRHFRPLTDLNEVAIHPFDDPDRYNLNSNVPSRLFFLNSRYWKTTTSTTNTIFAKSDVFRNYFFLFEKLAKEYAVVPGVEEYNTINRIWNNLVGTGGPVALFAPIPSIAVHVSFVEPLKQTTLMTDWKELWNEM